MPVTTAASMILVYLCYILTLLLCTELASHYYYIHDTGTSTLNINSTVMHWTCQILLLHPWYCYPSTLYINSTVKHWTCQILHTTTSMILLHPCYILTLLLSTELASYYCYIHDTVTSMLYINSTVMHWTCQLLLLHPWFCYIYVIY